MSKKEEDADITIVCDHPELRWKIDSALHMWCDSRKMCSFRGEIVNIETSHSSEHNVERFLYSKKKTENVKIKHTFEIVFSYGRDIKIIANVAEKKELQKKIAEQNAEESLEYYATIVGLCFLPGKKYSGYDNARIVAKQIPDWVVAFDWAVIKKYLIQKTHGYDASDELRRFRERLPTRQDFASPPHITFTNVPHRSCYHHLVFVPEINNKEDIDGVMVERLCQAIFRVVLHNRKYPPDPNGAYHVIGRQISVPRKMGYIDPTAFAGPQNPYVFLEPCHEQKWHGREVGTPVYQQIDKRVSDFFREQIERRVKQEANFVMAKSTIGRLIKNIEMKKNRSEWLGPDLADRLPGQADNLLDEAIANGVADPFLDRLACLCLGKEMNPERYLVEQAKEYVNALHRPTTA